MSDFEEVMLCMDYWGVDSWPDSVYAYGFKKTKVLSRLLNLFVKFMFNNITSIAISGKGFENKLRPYVKKNLNFNYLPNWAIKLNNNTEEIKLSDEARVNFTFAGNIGKVQNLENIINSFCSLPDEYQKRAQLNIVGDGSNLKNLKALAGNNQAIIFFKFSFIFYIFRVKVLNYCIHLYKNHFRRSYIPIPHNDIFYKQIC